VLNVVLSAICVLGGTTLGSSLLIYTTHVLHVPQARVLQLPVLLSCWLLLLRTKRAPPCWRRAKTSGWWIQKAS
jgi:hypothetical protein